jgi:hypothetical protein
LISSDVLLSRYYNKPYFKDIIIIESL